MPLANHHHTTFRRTIRQLPVASVLGALFCLPISGLAQEAAAPTVVPEVTYSFKTVNYPGDTFTQLLGINNKEEIAGYHGSGAAGHPNQGFVLTLPNTFVKENYPGSVQTQVIGINNNTATIVTDGFYIDSHGINHGFLKVGNNFSTIDFPGSTFNQLLGLNTQHQAVGFYNDAAGNSHGYTVEEFTPIGRVFSVLTIPNATSHQVTGINQLGELCGFYVDKAGSHGFTLNFGIFTPLNFPGATSTTAFGLNDNGQVVGTYTDAGGLIHGFVYSGGTFQSVDDPSGFGATIINGINNSGMIVGFYGSCASGGTTCSGFVGMP